MSKILEMKNICKSFPGVKALDGANLELNEGEAVVLMGENGAGKSTLMKILTGVYEKDSGEILYFGAPFVAKNPKDAQEKGISIIYQEFNLIPDLDVVENVFLSKEIKNKFGIVNRKLMEEKTRKILGRLNLKINIDKKVSELTVGEQQMVEIAKALNCETKILVMDEPTAALTESETDELFRVIKDLKKEKVGIVYISHRMEELKKVANSVLIMRDGRYVDSKRFEDTTIDEIIKLMVGRELKDQFPIREKNIGEEILGVKIKNSRGGLSEFNVRKGEVVALSGLMGAGRTELAKSIFGADKTFDLEIVLEGEKLKISSPIDAINNKIAYLTEDRKKDGLLLNLSVEDNIMVSNLGLIKNSIGKLDFIKSKDLCENYVKSMSIKTPSLQQEIKNLSGGNQQKAILARWLIQDKKVLIIDEPTRGIDVGAKREVYQLINNLASIGAGIIMISSELPEVLGMSDRVIVMHEKKITGILENKNLTQEHIMAYATGKEQII